MVPLFEFYEEIKEIIENKISLEEQLYKIKKK